MTARLPDTIFVFGGCAKNKMHEQTQTYLIPNNFIDEGRVFNGAIRIRYLIEAIIVFIAIAGPCWLLIPSTVQAKTGILLGCSLPLTMLALAGLNGDSLSDFLKSALAWKKYRQVMLYNENARTYQARPIDVMLSETNASDILMNSLEKWKNQRSQQNANMDLVENVDFVFLEDKEYEKMTPQEIREKQKREEKEARKARKKAKKKKKETAETGLLLPAPSFSVEEDEEKRKEQLNDFNTKENQSELLPVEKEESENAILQNDSQSVSLEKPSEPEPDKATMSDKPEKLQTEKSTEIFVFEDEELSVEPEPETPEAFAFEEDETPVEELNIGDNEKQEVEEYADDAQQPHA